MTQSVELDTSQGPFDRCLHCPNLGNGCSGPRTNAMTFERIVYWLRKLREIRRLQGLPVSIAAIAAATGLSKNTIDSFFAGRAKDVSRTTIGLIEDYLIGSDAKWPCPADLNADKDILYQDRPETLEALARHSEEMDNMQKAHKNELETANIAAQRKIDHLLRQIEDMREMLALLRRENEHKAALIDRITK